MSTDRNRLEQEALQALNKGSVEGALKAYLGILRLDPKDRRIRQKVAEIYVRTGKTQDAERHLREVADSILKEGNHRAAVAVFKQLVALKPDDANLQIELGDCYVAAGYPNDARERYDTAMRLHIGTSKSREAAKAARKLADLSPGEPALKLKVAELSEAGGDNEGARIAYTEVMDEYRRRGRVDEVGRVAEMLLRTRPEDVGVLLDAAAARVDAQDWKKALGYLQTAFVSAPKEPRTLDLLARSFEGAGQAEKALKVVLELSRVAQDRKDAPGEADALRRAARLAPDDVDVKERLAAAEQRVQRLERRLTSLVLSQPATEEELRAVVRGEVYARYGFTDRAEAALSQALEGASDSLPLIASLAEALAAGGRTEDALRWMERIVPRAGTERDQVLDRMAVLRGHAPAEEAADAPTPEPELPSFSIPAPKAEAPPPGPAPAPAPASAPAAAASDEASDEARGDRLAAAGDIPGAVSAYRAALAQDPTDEGVLAKIAALRSKGREAPPPAPKKPVSSDDAFARLLSDDGTFAEVSPDALDEVQPESNVAEARSLAAVGLWDDAIRLVSDDSTLVGRVVYAQALRGSGDSNGALDVLREATNSAAESDEGYDEALFELSALYTATGKHRAALRLLEELVDLNAGFRTTEVEARMRGLQKLLR